MKNLITQITEKYKFKVGKSTIIKGFSSTLTLKKFYLDIEETEKIEQIRVIIHELHEKNKPIKNLFRLSVHNILESDEPQDLFIFSTFKKIDDFLTAILS